MERRRRPRGPTATGAVPEVPATDAAPKGSGLAPTPKAAAPTPQKKYAEPLPLSAEQHAQAKEDARRRAAELSGQMEPTGPQPRGRDQKSDIDNRERARLRAAEILEHDIGLEDDDKYHVPAEAIPDGWKYMWRRFSTYGKEEPQYQVKIAQTGWRPVPADRHPEMMPSTGGPYLTIDRDGMRLMEIPMEIYRLLEQKEQRKAIEQVRIKTAQINQAKPGQFERRNRDQPMAQVRHGYEPLQIPQD